MGRLVLGSGSVSLFLMSLGLSLDWLLSAALVETESIEGFPTIESDWLALGSTFTFRFSEFSSRQLLAAVSEKDTMQ